MDFFPHEGTRLIVMTESGHVLSHPNLPSPDKGPVLKTEFTAMCRCRQNFKHYFELLECDKNFVISKK